jgi:uncharacterized protein YndB with AHSA1/START domain
MRFLIIGLLALLSAPAAAEVVHSENHGFEVNQSVALVVPPAEALTAFTRVSGWWIKDHTYSGDPANLSLDARPGGCLCERFPNGGGIEHMRVTYVEPGELLIMTGALGPLLHEAVNGVMIVHVERIAGGSRLTINYRASGFASGGAEKMAPMVDGMLSDTIKSYRKFAAGGGDRR